MRYHEIKEVSSRQPPGMLGVKERLANESPDQDENWFREWGIIDDLWITEDGGLGLFRAVTLPQPWEQNLKRNGHLYWSASPQGAHSYNADTNSKDAVEVKIAAILKGNAKVDWNNIWETILHFHSIGEDELRLAAGVKLTVVGISVDGVAMPNSVFMGKTLTA